MLEVFAVVWLKHDGRTLSVQLAKLDPA